MSTNELQTTTVTHDWWRETAQRHADVARWTEQDWASPKGCGCISCNTARNNGFEPVVPVITLSLPNQALLTSNALMNMNSVLAAQSSRGIDSVRTSLVSHADDLRRAVEQDVKETGELILLMARYIKSTGTGQSQLVEYARQWLESHAPELLVAGGGVDGKARKL